MAAQRQQSDPDNVTLVTGNNNKWAIIELLIAAGYVYYMTHPQVADQVTNRIHHQLHRIRYWLSVQRAKEEIRSLP